MFGYNQVLPQRPEVWELVHNRWNAWYFLVYLILTQFIKVHWPSDSYFHSFYKILEKAILQILLVKSKGEAKFYNSIQRDFEPLAWIVY